MSSVLALWSSRCTEAYALFPRLSPGIPHSVYSFHAHLLNTWSPQTSPCTIYVYPANPLGFGKRFPSFVVTWFESLKRLSLSEQAFNLHFMEPLPSQPQRILACSSLPTRCFEDARILPKSFPLLRNKVHPLSPASKTLQGLPVFADFFFPTHSRLYWSPLLRNFLAFISVSFALEPNYILPCTVSKGFYVCFLPVLPTKCWVLLSYLFFSFWLNTTCISTCIDIQQMITNSARLNE